MAVPTKYVRARAAEMASAVVSSPARDDLDLVAAPRLVEQDPLAVSKRVGAAVTGILTAALAAPEVQQLLAEHMGQLAGSWAPVVTAMVSAALAAWSKAADVRPRRGARQ
jgi:hypothetical protein